MTIEASSQLLCDLPKRCCINFLPMLIDVSMNPGKAPRSSTSSSLSATVPSSNLRAWPSQNVAVVKSSPTNLVYLALTFGALIEALALSLALSRALFVEPRTVDFSCLIMARR